MSHGIFQAQTDVSMFQLKFKRPMGAKPGDNLDNKELRLFRAKLILEETLETIKALGFDCDARLMRRFGEWDPDVESPVLHVEQIRSEGPNIVELSDGIADSTYVHLGTASTFGIDIEPIWREVHRTNMAKGVAPGDDVVNLKTIKPHGWKPPDVAGLLRQQGWGG